jgi:hypothetical protein
MSPETLRPVASDLVERHRAYQAMVSRLRDLVHTHVPPGATVAVVSKGDSDLVSFDGRQGWHFLQDSSGGYAGYHPRDSAAAIEELEALRSRGADFLALPATSNWWLDHYADFGNHLRGYETVAEEADVGTIFALREIPRASNAVPTGDPLLGLELQKHALLTAQITDLIDHLAPGEQPVSVLQPDGTIPVQIQHRLTLQLAPRQTLQDAPSSRSVGSLAALLDSHRREGAAYLIVPGSAFEWWQQHHEFRLKVEGEHRCITRQAHVCLIFELDTKGVSEK